MNPNALALWGAAGFIGYGLGDASTGLLSAGCAMAFSVVLSMLRR